MSIQNTIFYFFIIILIESYVILFCVAINLFQKVKGIYVIQKHKVLLDLLNYVPSRLTKEHDFYR